MNVMLLVLSYWLWTLRKVQRVLLPHLSRQYMPLLRLWILPPLSETRRVLWLPPTNLQSLSWFSRMCEMWKTLLWRSGRKWQYWLHGTGRVWWNLGMWQGFLRLLSGRTVGFVQAMQRQEMPRLQGWVGMWQMQGALLFELLQTALWTFRDTPEGARMLRMFLPCQS